MAAPQVQTLSQIMADLNPAYAAQTAVNQKQQELVPAKYNAQRAGLAAEKVQGFNQINTQANARGMAFSGIPVDEQATYLSTKYLPGVQAANQQEQADILALQSDAAKLEYSKTLQGLSTLEGQKKDLNSWQQQQEQNAFTAAENAKERAATAARYNQENAVPTMNQAIIDSLTAISSQENWRKSGATEDMIGQIATQYGVPVSQVASIVYPLRKQSWNF